MDEQKEFTITQKIKRTKQELLGEKAEHQKEIDIIDGFLKEFN